MLQTAKYCITVSLKGSWEAASALPTFAWACGEMVSQTTLKKKKHTAETTGPAFKGRKQCLHFFLLAQNFFFPWDFHSLLNPAVVGGWGKGEKKKNQLLRSFWMET